MRISDVRPYLKKLVFLSNKQHKPMLYIDRDYHKVPPLNVHYYIYKLKHDHYCQYITLRIIVNKHEFQQQQVKIQVLDFVSSVLPHERYTSIQKLRVLNELQVYVTARHRPTSSNQNANPLVMSRLFIKRRSEYNFHEFYINY